MTRRKIAYIAHPLSAPTIEQVTLNRFAAAQWAVWAMSKGYSPSCSWIVLTGLLVETPENRAAGLECDIALAITADELWLCGGRVSEGMAIERDAALAAGVIVMDYTSLGPLPLYSNL